MDARTENRALSPIAHVKRDVKGDWGEPQSLLDHIEGTAALAESFASRFGNGDWGRLAGLWHDLGKYKREFQEYIRKSSGYESDEASEGGGGRVDHSIVGALWAKERYKDFGMAGRVLGYMIAGHHAGLPDWTHEIGTGGALRNRLEEDRHLREALDGKPPDYVLTAALAESPPFGEAPAADGDEVLQEQLHLWIRMLFSCLVDADRLDTAAYTDPDSAKTRSKPGIDLRVAKDKLDQYLARLQMKAIDSPLNQCRREILTQCRANAAWEPGVFSLTVPTGGGKTLAGMAFALEHALRHGKSRIVVAIPYTSIIEQTADVYRKVFGDEAVVEHHSNLDPDKETTRSRLASENWDAPIIVTTNVQLFESLFASRASACRKLHNLVDSVIILDEAQMLPTEYLRPIVSAMKGLSSFFGASIILSTATQPALAGRIEFGLARLKGFEEGSVREIMSDPGGLSRRLRRVEILKYEKGDERVTWEELARELSTHKQVLCIVNTRKDCRELHALLPDSAIHLSASMCPEHRSETIAAIKAALKNEEQIRVVSTQLVEAGVDIDFPVVYRASAGLDSIAQAAGRCNREGRLNAEGKIGKVVVFKPPKDAPPGLLRKGQDAGEEMFRLYPDAVANLDPEAFKRYFILFYARANSFDAKDIMASLAGSDAQKVEIQFRTAASRFKLIDDQGQRSVIVDYSGKRGREDERFSSQALVAKVEAFGPDRDTMRRLQRYAVSLPTRAFEALASTGDVRLIERMEGLFVQSSSGLYDRRFGLRLEGPVFNAFDTII